MRLTGTAAALPVEIYGKSFLLANQINKCLLSYLAIKAN